MRAGWNRGICRNNADYNKNKHSLLSRWAPGGHALSIFKVPNTWKQKVRIQNRSADAPYASYFHSLNYHKKKNIQMRSLMKKMTKAFTQHAVWTILLLPLMHVVLAIRRCVIPNKTNHCSAPALKCPCLLANPAFGQCSAKEDYKSTWASTPSPFSSQAKVILLDFERETKRKNTIPSTQLSSDPWVWHLPDGWGAFFWLRRKHRCAKTCVWLSLMESKVWKSFTTARSIHGRRMLSQ